MCIRDRIFDDWEEATRPFRGVFLLSVSPDLTIIQKECSGTRIRLLECCHKFVQPIIALFLYIFLYSTAIDVFLNLLISPKHFINTKIKYSRIFSGQDAAIKAFAPPSAYRYPRYSKTNEICSNLALLCAQWMHAESFHLDFVYFLSSTLGYGCWKCSLDVFSLVASIATTTTQNTIVKTIWTILLWGWGEFNSTQGLSLIHI